MFLSDEENIKEYGVDLKERVRKSCDAYFKTDTPGTRSRYDYYQGKIDCFNYIMKLLSVEHLQIKLGKE